MEHVPYVDETLEGMGFIREERTLTDGWIQPTRNALYYSHGLTPPPAVITTQHRYVTTWVVDETTTQSYG